MPYLCIYRNCRTRASFGNERAHPLYCKSHKEELMINVKDKRCICGKTRPTFNIKGEQPKFCSKCKADGMIDVANKRCKNDTCQTTGNKKYRGYCSFCFQHLFPTDPLTF